MEHDIHTFVAHAQRDLQEEYDRIQLRAKEDPGTAGDQGEENWATLLRHWLPRYFHIVTKGRILTESGYASPQVDILVLHPSYPSILLDKKLYLSGGVAAAFECKTTLKASHITEAIKTAALLKRAVSKQEGSPYKELYAAPIYGLLAHSHSWKSPGSTPCKNIEDSIRCADEQFVAHPRECIDLIAVSDIATWSVHKVTYMSPLSLNYDAIKHIYGVEGSAVTCLMRQEIAGDRQETYFSPIGSLLSDLYTQLAWTFRYAEPRRIPPES